ncbi:MAG: adenosylhomocysteinase [Bacillota bacterium]|nr:adenosylhomocysteinase [Bacillota bacterium]
MGSSVVRDPSLAPGGKLKIDWVSQHMPVLGEIKKEFTKELPFAGRRVAICLHLEAKTAYLAQVIRDGGAQVAVAGSNPLSTQDDVAAALAESGVLVYAWRDAARDEYRAFLHRVLDTEPDLIIDDGADLVTLIHTERRELLKKVKGACEETTTGIHRLRAMEARGVLEIPVVAVNDAYCKHLFDNRYGTGQATWDGIMRATNLVVAGKTVVVVGYGWCGKGVAMRGRGLGARVIVCEVDPISAIEAIMDGFGVMPLGEAARVGDFFVTVTGNRDVIRGEHFQVMKDGAILANAGHFDVEISKPDLDRLAVSRRVVRPGVEEYRLADGRRLHLLAEGRLVNLAAADGHPAEIMDLSFGLQALALRHVQERGPELGRGVLGVPREMDEKVARLWLAGWGVSIDGLTGEQAEYLRSWRL